MSDLNGKCVVVTGGIKPGIGRAIVEQIATDGGQCTSCQR